MRTVGPFSFIFADGATPSPGTDYSVSNGIGAYSDYTLLSFLTAGKTFIMNLTNDVSVDYLLVGAGADIDTTNLSDGGAGGTVVTNNSVTLVATSPYSIFVGVPGGAIQRSASVPLLIRQATAAALQAANSKVSTAIPVIPVRNGLIIV